MSVRVNIVGGEAIKPVKYPDGANTKTVKEDLFGRFGQGGLEQNDVGVLSETLAPGEYEYYLTPQQGQFIYFMLWINHFLVLLDDFMLGFHFDEIFILFLLFLILLNLF